MTAKKAKENAQFEVLLKVKQRGENPTFAFLDISNELHAYYTWQRDIGFNHNNERNESHPPLRTGVLESMALYDSSSSDDDGRDYVNDSMHNGPKESDQAKDSIQSSKTITMDSDKMTNLLDQKEQQKRRLEKAKLWKENFSFKMS